jgi:RNA polymerase sigma factor (sigma-70 family)
MNESQLIKKIKKDNCSDSLRELENMHGGLCVKIIKKYLNQLNDKNFSIEDMLKDKVYVVYQSALSFDPKRNIKYSTWLGNQIRYFCLNTLNKNKNNLCLDNEKIKYLVEKKQIEESNTQMDQSKLDYIFDIIHNMKDKRIEKIFKMRYFDSKKLKAWNEIGKKLHISTQTAINIHNKALEFLNKKITSKNLFDKI